jgi:tRNA dimethylallyltransferase
MAAKVLVVAGPTAVGKTALSLRLARARAAEVISGDAVQVYRGLDIGSAKADAATLSHVPHHLIDHLSFADSYSAHDFARLARAAVHVRPHRSFTFAYAVAAPLFP